MSAEQTRTYVCRVPNCQRRVQYLAGRLCGAHYQRQRQGLDVPMGAPIRSKTAHDRSVTVCEVTECAKPSRYGRLVDGRRMYLCSMHETRWSRFRDFNGRARMA